MTAGFPDSGETDVQDFGSAARREHAARVARAAGFTLLEVLVTLAVLGIALSVLLLNLRAPQQRQAKVSHLEEAAALLTSARHEAGRRGVPVVVVVDRDNDRLLAWADVDGDPALTFEPVPGATPRTTDYLVGEHRLPAGGSLLDFHGPDDPAPRQDGMTSGMSLTSDGRPAWVFEPDGSVREPGAVRFGDVRGNFFELRVGPAETAGVHILKWNGTTDRGGPGFFPRGTDESSGRSLWRWS